MREEVMEQIQMEEVCDRINQLNDDAQNILKEILFDADVSDSRHMRELIYNFGSHIKSNDRVGRLIFVRLASVFLLL